MNFEIELGFEIILRIICVKGKRNLKGFSKILNLVRYLRKIWLKKS
jgi:hypothetical protein